jgi:hypothetical protein
MTIEFFQTKMGHVFYEGTMRSIASSLKSLSESFACMPSISNDLEAIAGLLKGFGEGKPISSDQVSELIKGAGHVVCRNATVWNGLGKREHAAILAGLRMFQRALDPKSWTRLARGDGLEDIEGIATNLGEFKHLTPDEIDRLCAEINGELDST